MSISFGACSDRVFRGPQDLGLRQPMNQTHAPMRVLRSYCVIINSDVFRRIGSTLCGIFVICPSRIGCPKCEFSKIPRVHIVGALTIKESQLKQPNGTTARGNSISAVIILRMGPRQELKTMKPHDSHTHFQRPIDYSHNGACYHCYCYCYPCCCRHD